MNIDYGCGKINIDLKTGIRFGVISQNSILQAWADSSEPDYGPATCPKCGNEAQTMADASESISFDDFAQYSVGCLDYACEACKITFDSCEAFPEQPDGSSYEGDGYKMTSCLDSDVMVIESPFYTHAPFCSPCVPGAGNLDDAAHAASFTCIEYEQELIEKFEVSGPRTYAVGHDWFEPPIAPYPVYGVISGRPCFPNEWYGNTWDYSAPFTMRA